MRSNDAVKQELYNLVSKGHKSFSYRTARKHLFGKLHLRQNSSGYYVKDLYCNKNITNKDISNSKKIGPMMIPDHRIINCEHTWPQSRFSKRESKSTQKSDLHHLFPTDSNANSTRGNKKFADVYGRPLGYDCKDSSKGRPINGGHKESFEPPSEHKGNVARALFYFSIRYRISIDPVEESYLKRWHREDPVDNEESDRNNQIQNIQGNRNPFIDHPQLVESISDF